MTVKRKSRFMALRVARGWPVGIVLGPARSAGQSLCRSRCYASAHHPERERPDPALAASSRMRCMVTAILVISSAGACRRTVCGGGIRRSRSALVGTGEEAVRILLERLGDLGRPKAVHAGLGHHLAGEGLQIAPHDKASNQVLILRAINFRRTARKSP